MEFDRQALVSIFVTEAADGLSTLRSALYPPSGDLPAPSAIHDQYITAHTLKGASSLYGFSGVSCLAECLETAVENSEGVLSEEWPGRVEMLRSLVETLHGQIDLIRCDGAEEPSCWEKWKADHPHWLPGSVLSPADGTEFQSLPNGYFVPDLDAEVLSYFVPEAQEYLEAMEASVLALEKKPDDAETIQQLFRTSHTLKGSAHTIGFKSIGDIVHRVEDCMGEIRDGRLQMDADLADAVFRVIDVVKLLMKRDSRALQKTKYEFAAVMHRLTELKGCGASIDSTVSSPSTISESEREIVSEQGRDIEARQLERRPEADRRKESETRSPEESGVIRVSRERLERLLNLVGELVISRGRLEQRLVALEQLSDQVLMFKGRMLDSVKTFEEKHAFTLPATASTHGTTTTPELRPFTDFGSLEFDRYDDFNILARRMAEVSADVGEAMSQLSNSIRKSREDMSQLQRLTLGMRDEIARARMVPIGTPFTRFRRAVREMAKATGKEVTLAVSGEHTEVDTGIVERLVDPLIHLVRNAVYHGIERADVRVARGKPATGTVYLHAAHRGSAVVIEVEDDGGGIDVQKIKSKAVALGLVRPQVASSMPDPEAIKLIFLPGFSTADEVGEQAGRGVGMDVVKRTVEGMNGQIEVETELGVGTKFTLRLPLTLLISMALLVRVGSERYALPLQSIREVVLPPPGAVQDVGGRPMLQVGEETIEVRSLARQLGLASADPTGPAPVVIVRTATGVMGLSVDELLGRQEIVIKSLGTLRPFVESCFVGASIDPEGHVILVLDVGRLTDHAYRNEELVRSGPAPFLIQKNEEDIPNGEDQTGPQVPRVLLIDDSLSIRKFVGRMLESAGYEVETAVDGEEGLRKASGASYHLVITDLEMPKLNGYEVIQALRDRPQTKATPILVMTTRAGEKHRQMALSIGASGYIAKPVEERALILEVGRWIGRTTGAHAESR